jgi:hypothetical protein
MEPMKRRLLLTAGSWLALGLGACAAPPAAQAQPAYRVSLEQLGRVLARRFPLRYPVSGLLEIEMREPRLRLLPELNRLGSELPIEAAGPALRRAYSGSVDVDFGLRYEASDQSIRAHGIRVNTVHVEGLGRDAARMIDSYLRQLSAQALAEVVLHRLRPEDLALSSAMGLEPGSISVTPQGLTIGFVPQK